MKPHKLLPNNSNSLLSWDKLFEISYRIYTDPNLSQLLSVANLFPIANKSKKQRNNPNSTYVLYNLNRCGIEPIEKEFNEFYSILGIEQFKQEKEKQQCTCDTTIYFSFFPQAQSHGIHRDVTDIYHWQHLGYTQWTIYDKGKHVYILNPGDVIFVPAGMYHDVLPLTARAGITFGFFPKDYSNELSSDYFDKRNIHFDYDDPFK